MQQIEGVHDHAMIYQLAVHQAVVRLLDYFEDKENIYMCFQDEFPGQDSITLNNHILKLDLDDKI